MKLAPAERQSTAYPVRRRSSTVWAAVLAGVVMLAACNLPQPQAPVTPVATEMATGTPTAQPTASPSPTDPAATASPGIDPVDAELARYGVTVIYSGPVDVAQRQSALAAVIAMASMTASLGQVPADPYETFTKTYGKTVIRIYPDRTLVDGVHVGVNCGWEGLFASGCRLKETYPEQEFPHGAWLILLGGGYMTLSPSDENVGLFAHEIMHNLTWGGGHLPDNVNGYSYVHYVGDEFAIRYMDNLGVQAGRDTYVDETARSANPSWRSELTADALASWALGEVTGPDGPMVNHYLHDLMACKIVKASRC